MAKVFSTSMPIGETATGLPTPAFFDPHYAIRINKPPVTLITGSPGSGKTVAALLLASHSALLNKTTFILDPKGDFLSLKLLEDAGEIENVHVWSIFQNIEEGTVRESNIGMLDPTCLTSDVNENASLTLETINALVKNMSANQRNALIPIIQDVTHSPNPSMNTIRMILSRSRDAEISTLSHELGLALSMPAGKLLVASSKINNRLKLDKGVVVASLMGLSMPASSKQEDNYLEKERLSVAIIRLLTHMVLDVMKKVPKTISKTLFIDEAWAVFNNASGRDLIDEVSLLGRSLNMAVVLATQSPSHVMGKEGGANLDTTISTRFAFRNTSDIDNEITTKAMSLPKDAGYEGIFKNLANGQCLMKDSQEQFAFIDVMLPDGWLDIFDTTPSPEEHDN
ncbi:MAG TPA: hypothetical protein GXZ90_04505 [Clostridiales bacterium]|nr:hypothetical protein [Clostridiales bacterium]